MARGDPGQPVLGEERDELLDIVERRVEVHVVFGREGVCDLEGRGPPIAPLPDGKRGLVEVVGVAVVRIGEHDLAIDLRHGDIVTPQRRDDLGLS
jgi:hypothetical protein